MDADRAGLSAVALKKAAILSAIAQYRNGSYGLKRLQKVVYRASRESEVKPFTYRLWLFGQHSRELTVLLDEMIVDGLISTEGLPRGTGLQYRLTDPGKSVMGCMAPIERVLPGYMAGLEAAMREVGLRRDEEINVWAKAQPELEGKKHGDSLVEGNVPESSDLPDLTNSQIEDLELALNTGLLGGVERVVRCLKSTTADFGALHRWDGESSVSTSSS